MPSLRPCLLALPAELQMIIASYLVYPDLLSLKITHPAFNSLIQPSVYDRIDWLLSRPALGLSVPCSAACSFKTDRSFVANKEVKLILKRRRQHLECAESTFQVGRIERCLLDGGQICQGAFQRIEARMGQERKLLRTGRLRNATWLRGDALGLWMVVVLVVILPSLTAWMLRS